MDYRSGSGRIRHEPLQRSLQGDHTTDRPAMNDWTGSETVTITTA